MNELQDFEILEMSYVQLLAALDEVNRPPGGKDSIRRIVHNTFITKDSYVLDVGCNSGYSSFEIAHVAKSYVIGMDISQEMIDAANRARERDSNKELVKFIVGDGMHIPFEDNSFDVTMSGGSTAFIEDKARALSEYARVTKVWGFVADVNFFYKHTPPPALISELNNAMGINIQPWDQKYWLDIYAACGLERYYTHIAEVHVPSSEDIHSYCFAMAAKVHATPTARAIIADRLESIMTLFAKNHEYLGYGVFILRKRDEPEQIALFGA